MPSVLRGEFEDLYPKTIRPLIPKSHYRCSNCPNCRVKITSVVKIYLPPELRTSQSGSGAAISSSSCISQIPEPDLEELEMISSMGGGSEAAAVSVGVGVEAVAGGAGTGPGGQPKVTTAA